MTFAVTAIAVVLVAAFLGMLLSWRRRARSQGDLRAPAASAGAPHDAAVVRADVLGGYVATTFADRPLDRVVAAGLGFRARANLMVTDTGIRFDRVGSAPLFVPRDHVRGAGAASWTIDRGVEPDGLTVLAWNLDSPDGPVPVESAFRIDPEPRAAFVAAVQTLMEAPRADS